MSPRSILVFGAGALGMTYAACLAEAGHAVTLVARSRFEELRDNGLTVRRQGGEWRTVRVNLVEAVREDEHYDMALVLVRYNHLDAVLPLLAGADIDTVLVMVQNAGGYASWREHLGDRLMVGFAGLGANFVDGGLEYQVAPRWAQPTTLGEPDGGDSQRARDIAALLDGAGFPTWVCSNMDAWQKWHAGWITILANSMQHAGGDIDRIRSRAHIRLTIDALTESVTALRAAGIPVEPPKLAWVLALPAFALRWVVHVLVRLPMFTRDLLPNAMTAEGEALAVGRQLVEIGEQAGVSMPAWKRLLTRPASWHPPP